MKKFVYTIMLLAIVPALLVARFGTAPDLYQTSQHMKLYPKQIDVKATMPFEEINKMEKDGLPSLLTTTAYRAIIERVDAGWNHNGEIFSPFQYEPISNTLGIVLSRYGRGPTYDVDSLLRSYVWFYFSNDYGTTWSGIVLDSSDNVYVNPSFGMINPGNETNPLNLWIAVHGPNYTPAKDYRMEHHAWIIYNGKDKTKEVIPEVGPSSNNDNGDYWFYSRMITAKDLFYVFSRLQPKTDDFGNVLSQFGTYGFGRTDVYLNDYYSEIPSKWKYDNFYVQPGNLGSTFNEDMQMDSDKDGNLYACFNNILANAETSKYMERLPMVVKSTNKGETWSDYDKVPFATIKAFLAEWGGGTEVKNSSFVTIPYVRTYSQAAFAVTGNDSYSYFYRLNVVKAADTIEIMLVEAMKKAGQPWKIVPISWINQPIYGIRDTLGNPLQPADIFEYTPKENEIEVAKTADGQNLIVKWLDFAVANNNYKRLNFDAPAYRPTALGYNIGTRLDSIETTDIFVAHRAMSDDKWSDPINVTNDKWFNKITYMPPVVKDLSNIPIFEYIARSFKSAGYIEPNKNLVRANAPYNYPYQLQNIIFERNVTQNIIFGVFDINNPTPITNPTLMPDKGDYSSVEEFINPEFSINGISPNPAENNVEFAFTLKAYANVSIEIYNAMGQKVKSVYNGVLTEGVYGQSTNVSDLAVGTYYVAITVNGKRTAQVLNVVR